MPRDGYWTKRRLGRRQALIGAGAFSAAAASAALLGCGDDDEPVSAPTGATSAPKRGGHLVRHWTADQAHHDVHLNIGLLHIHGSSQVYSRLLRRKLGADISGIEIIPDGDVAANWEQVDDVTYLFKMRPNAKWQNIAPVNGRAVRADDVAYSFKRQIDSKVGAASLPGIERVTAVDPGTLRLELKKPDADFLGAMTTAYNSIVAREAVELKGDLKEGPVIGSGAWIFQEWVPGKTMKFVRNPDYHRGPLPYLDSFEVVQIPDDSTRIAAFRTGQLHILTTPFDNIELLKKSNPNINVRTDLQSGPVAGNNLMLLADAPPMHDIRVRQALSKAIDRKTLRTTLNNGRGWFGGALMSVTSRDQLLPEAEFEKLLSYDPARAKSLLSEAGVGGWKPVISVAVGDSQPLGELLQAQLKSFGIDGTIAIMDPATYGKWFAEGGRELVAFIRGSWLIGTNADLHGSYRSDGTRNLARIKDATLDRLIDAQAGELRDKARRNQLLYEIQRKIIDFAASTPIWTNEPMTASQPYVRDLWTSMGTPWREFSEYVWFDR